MAIQSLAVFCGSKNGNNPLFAQQAEELGEIMAEKTSNLSMAAVAQVLWAQLLMQ